MDKIGLTHRTNTPAHIRAGVAILHEMAARDGYDFLAYLLAMAQDEATALERQRKAAA